MSKRVYIAGPMRGYKGYNYPAFDSARDDLKAKGWDVISPADMDRKGGFDPDTLPDDHDWSKWPDALDAENTIIGCFASLMTCDVVVMLQGWQQSKGATAERAIALWLGLDVWDYSHEDILAEALRITNGDRQNAYGPPDQDFTRTAAMWSAIKGVEFSAREVAMFMIAMKLSRETHQCKRDNWVDIAGYAKCGSLCR